MPYKSIDELPEALSTLPTEAQEIYRVSFNQAWDNYAKSTQHESGSHEEVSHRMAWAAVRKEYFNQGGNWKRKEN